MASHDLIFTDKFESQLSLISAVMPPKAVEDMSPDELSVGLEESLEQMRAGKVMPFEEAMDAVRRGMD